MAGGRGTRLRPFTHLINKHFLPVYDKPLIYYPLLTLKESGIIEVFIVTDPASLVHYKKLIGQGEKFGLKISYAVQKTPLGLAHAVGHAEKFAKNSKLAVIFGDNIFTDSEQIKKSIEDFSHEDRQGCKLFLKKVPDPERFGIAYFKNKKLASIVEKPKNPKSNLAVVGLYLYDPKVFSFIKTLTPSKRGELEITDLNNIYLKQGLADYEVVKGKWVDAGTFDSLLYASLLMMKKNKNPQNNIKMI